MMRAMNRVLNVLDARPISLLVAVALLLTLPMAWAQGGVLDEPTFDAAVGQFLAGADGFDAVDVDSLEAAVRNHLADADAATASASHLSPLPLAITAVEAVEGRLERSRYQLGVRLIHVQHASYPYPVSNVLVSAERYNLGPVVHAELVEELGADMVAPAEEFGVGPNTAWRFVMQPVPARQAVLVSASRKELSDEAAGAASCLYGECLSLTWAHGPEAWEQVAAPPFEELAPGLVLPRGEWSLLEPEAMMAVVTALASFDLLAWEVSGPDTQIVQAVVDLNLGQDFAVAATLREGHLLDDSLAAIWHQAIDLGWAGGESAYVAYECRRGEDAFAPPGSYCP